jgi:hypothetical protein
LHEGRIAMSRAEAPLLNLAALSLTGNHFNGFSQRTIQTIPLNRQPVFFRSRPLAMMFFAIKCFPN